MGTSREHDRPLSGEDGFWEPVRSNVVDCFAQFFDYLLPRESLAVVRLVGYCLRERLAWCDLEGQPRAPREVVKLVELDGELTLDRKSIRVALERACESHYLEPVLLPDEQGGGAGFRLKLDLQRFTLDEREFAGFYPLPTHRIRVPLEFFTTVLEQEALATIKVVACILRMTLGSIDNLGRTDVTPAISQQQFVRRMNMGRRQAIQGVQAALSRSYIRRLEQGSLESGRPSTYALYWRHSEQALRWPAAAPQRLDVVPLNQALGKRDHGRVGKGDQEGGKKGSGDGEKGITAPGKRDQVRGKKGSGPETDTDLIKDLDLRSSTSSRTPMPLPAPAEAAAGLFERVKRRFPLGNAHIIGRFIAERGSFVGEVLEALEEVDPAFLKRFTRTADAGWAAFHTCCQQGILPPKKRAAPRPEAPPLALAADGWNRLGEGEKVAEMVASWRKMHALCLGHAADEEALASIREELERRVAGGAGRDALEQWLLEDVARRLGHPIGPIGRAT